MDQNAPLGTDEPNTSCRSRPYTTTAFASGGAEPGCGTTDQAMMRLNTSAAQYGGRIRQARRCAKRALPPSCQPLRAGETAREKPDRAMNTTTARCPYSSQ